MFINSPKRSRTLQPLRPALLIGNTSSNRLIKSPKSSAILPIMSRKDTSWLRVATLGTILLVLPVTNEDQVMTLTIKRFVLCLLFFGCWILLVDTWDGVEGYILKMFFLYSCHKRSQSQNIIVVFRYGKFANKTFLQQVRHKNIYMNELSHEYPQLHNLLMFKYKFDMAYCISGQFSTRVLQEILSPHWLPELQCFLMYQFN